MGKTSVEENSRYMYVYINVGAGLPWHKVLNAVVAELSIYK